MYTITEEKTIIENHEYTVYGIRYGNEYYVKDVSDDKRMVERFVEDCNRYRLDPIHLYEKLENLLGELWVFVF